MTIVAGDMALAPGGKTLLRVSDADAWAQQTAAAFGFTRGTYRHDRDAGVDVSIHLFANSITEETLAEIFRAAIWKRPNVAEITSLDVTHEGRDWTIRAVVALQRGGVATLDLTI